MDRNLGASRVATSISDSLAYGDLYQWGRRSDGHQCRNSATVPFKSSTDYPSHNDFIITPGLIHLNNLGDWRFPSNDSLWQGLNGTNNPCPIGYRVPTKQELNEEIQTWNTDDLYGAFDSPLKFTPAGARNSSNDEMYYDQGAAGAYWTSNSVIGFFSIPHASFLRFSSTHSEIIDFNRGYGFSVRCIKN